MKHYNKEGSTIGVNILALQKNIVCQMLELGGSGLILDELKFP